ncbi:MAG: flippase-like domain-containing protein, partial [Chloroflexi bacterium]|nr:flippase-like domain-containing protein [Chloroflexota bacterium]
AGELLRAYVLKRKEGISVSASLATVIVERLFDGVTMLLFVFVALPFVPMPDFLRQIVIVFSLLFFGALLIFFIIAARPERTQRVYSWLVTHVLPSHFQALAHGVFDRFISGLHSLRSGRDVLMIFITSLGIWLAETVKYWFVLHAFPGADVPFIVLMLMNGVVNLATTIPSSPGYVGTFDLPGIEILVAYGVSRDVATAYTAVLHAALWLPITLLGAYFMWREHLSVPQITREVREEEEAAPAGAQ